MELKYNLTRYYENFIFKTPLWREFDNTMWFLKWKWLDHIDLRYNPWNVMLGKDWKVYIIDFGRVDINLK
jgi:hypothetical protein